MREVSSYRRPTEQGRTNSYVVQGTKDGTTTQKKSRTFLINFVLNVKQSDSNYEDNQQRYVCFYLVVQSNYYYIFILLSLLFYAFKIHTMYCTVSVFLCKGRRWKSSCYIWPQLREVGSVTIRCKHNFFIVYVKPITICIA